MADSGLELVKRLGWPRARREPGHDAPRRILLLRLERIGDLLMALDAIAMARSLAPQSEITLAVGSWNLPIARLIRDVDRIDVIDAPWMASGPNGASWAALARMARVWRSRDYDCGVNLEPDIRSNLLLRLSNAQRRVGFLSGGGGALLTDALSADPAAHVAENAMAVVRLALGGGERTIEEPTGRLHIPDEARRRATELLSHTRAGTRLIGIQPGAGRKIKEWDAVRFAEVGARLAAMPDASVILVGSAADRAALDQVRAAWPGNVPVTQLPVETDLVVLAAVLEQLSLFITGDTGPMHLAAAVGTPVLAIFGPSLPTRFAPRAARSRIVRIDIPCSPCNLLRRPPSRCVGHVPDCLAGITSAEVLRAADELLGASSPRG
jgi:ADP-heptose:LPS heptosyltransferase